MENLVVLILDKADWLRYENGRGEAGEIYAGKVCAGDGLSTRAYGSGDGEISFHIIKPSVPNGSGYCVGGMGIFV